MMVLKTLTYIGVMPDLSNMNFSSNMAELVNNPSDKKRSQYPHW